MDGIPLGILSRDSRWHRLAQNPGRFECGVVNEPSNPLPHFGTGDCAGHGGVLLAGNEKPTCGEYLINAS